MVVCEEHLPLCPSLSSEKIHFIGIIDYLFFYLKFCNAIQVYTTWLQKALSWLPKHLTLSYPCKH